jgi:uncharacterized membrane protein YhaH (DUF805 family)
MNFGQAISTCLRKYATFPGRAARPEYWWFFLFEILLIAAASRINETLSGLISLALLLPALAVGARRLHDIGKSGWWLLLSLVPVIGWIVLLVWAVQKSDAQANAYGASPLAEAAAFLPPGAA